jgi:hypothetical protein
MIRLTLLLIFFALSSLKGYSQSTTLKYIGVIKVDNIGLFSYQLNFEAKGDKISGTTITNAGNNKETKSAISGRILQNGKQLDFSETKIIQTDVKDKATTFCFVSSKLAKKEKGKLEILEGKFTGKDENGNPCGTGRIYLTRKSSIMSDSVDVTNLIKSLANGTKEIKMPTPSIKELAVGPLNKVTCTEKTVKVRFYDGNLEDRDQISITYNETMLVESYLLTNEGISFNLNIEAGKPNLIVITTHNTGVYGMNTAHIELSTAPGKISTYRFDAEAKKEISIQLRLP